MDEKEFVDFTLRYMTGEIILGEEYETLTDYQKYSINVNKKIIKRLNRGVIENYHHSLTYKQDE